MSIRIQESMNNLDIILRKGSFEGSLHIPADSEPKLPTPNDLKIQNPVHILWPKMMDIKKALLECGYDSKSGLNLSTMNRCKMPPKSQSKKLYVSMDKMMPSRADSPQVNNGSIILLGLSREESRPVTPQIDGACEASPLKRIQPKLAMSIEFESEYPHERNFEVTPRSLLIKEFQSELEMNRSRNNNYWQNWLKSGQDLIPETFEELKPDSMCDSTEDAFSENIHPVPMSNFKPLKEFFHLQSGENLSDLSWVYTPSMVDHDAPGTPKPVFLVLSKELVRTGSPAKVEWFELKVPSNTPNPLKSDHLDIEMEAKEIKLSAIGQEMDIEMSIEN